MSTSSYQSTDVENTSMPIECEMNAVEQEEMQKPAFTSKVVTALVLSAAIVGLGLSSQYGAVSSTVSTPTMSMSTLVDDALYCPFKFKQGDSRYVPDSCVFFAEDDINYEKNLESNALYVCASKSISPHDIKEGTFEKYGISIDSAKGLGVSLITTGQKTKISIYEGKFSGDEDLINMSSNHALTADTYDGSKAENDAVHAAMMYSTDLSMPVNCEDLLEYVKSMKGHENKPDSE